MIARLAIPRHRVALWTLVALFACPVGVARAQYGVGRRSLIGTNLSGVGSIVTQWDFADLMKGSNPWVYEGGPKAGQRTPVDAQGNPLLLAGEKANTLPRLGIAQPPYDRIPDYPTGVYTIAWEGRGTFLVSGDGDSEVITANGPGTRTFNVTTGAQTLFLRIDSMDQVDRLRNIRILMPTYGPGQANANQTFHQQFVDRSITHFGNVRFMDWNRVNDTTHSQWSERTSDRANQYSIDTGVPIEQQLRLVNQANGDAWFNMPAHASDDYVTKFAQAALYGIDGAGNPYTTPQASPVVPPIPADRKIYVEFANEAWNQSFEGYDYIRQQAIAAGLNPVGLNQDFAKQWAVEARQDFDIWKGVFGAAGVAERVKRVAAIQTVNRFVSPLFLKELVVAGVPQFDVLSPAFYVGVNSSSYNAATTKDKILDDLFASLQSQVDPTVTTFLPGTPFQVVGPRGDWLLWKQFADQYDVELVAYEGGQSIDTGVTTVPWYDDYVAAQRDPRMYDFYTAWLEAIFDTVDADGVDFFSSVGQITQFGAWGHLETQDQPLAEAPKFRAILDFARRLGDFDLNGWYNAADIDLLRASRGLAPTGDLAAFDMNGDGAITEDDVAMLLEERLQTRTGDVDLDGDVDGTDLALWMDGFAGTARWIAGDLTGDLQVDGSDFLLWQRELGSSSALVSVSAPEPATLMLAILFTPCLLRVVRPKAVQRLKPVNTVSPRGACGVIPAVREFGHRAVLH